MGLSQTQNVRVLRQFLFILQDTEYLSRDETDRQTKRERDRDRQTNRDRQ